MLCSRQSFPLVWNTANYFQFGCLLWSHKCCFTTLRATFIVLDDWKCLVKLVPYLNEGTGNWNGVGWPHWLVCKTYLVQLFCWNNELWFRPFKIDKRRPSLGFTKVEAIIFRVFRCQSRAQWEPKKKNRISGSLVSRSNALLGSVLALQCPNVQRKCWVCMSELVAHCNTQLFRCALLSFQAGLQRILHSSTGGPVCRRIHLCRDIVNFFQQVRQTTLLRTQPAWPVRKSHNSRTRPGMCDKVCPSETPLRCKEFLLVSQISVSKRDKQGMALLRSGAGRCWLALPHKHTSKWKTEKGKQKWGICTNCIENGWWMTSDSKSILTEKVKTDNAEMKHFPGTVSFSCWKTRRAEAQIVRFCGKLVSWQNYIWLWICTSFFSSFLELCDHRIKRNLLPTKCW